MAPGGASATQTPHLQLDYRMAKEDFPLKSDTGHFTLPILSRILFLVSRVHSLTLSRELTAVNSTLFDHIFSRGNGHAFSFTEKRPYNRRKCFRCDSWVYLLCPLSLRRQILLKYIKELTVTA